jgi:hypothetical protein
MTTQSLNERMRQHKRDAGTDSCSISSKLCQKKLPTDLKALYRRLRDDASKFAIRQIKSLTASYSVAHREELRQKAKHATL